MPFDRMVRAVDKWAGRRGRLDVFAQIGETDWRPEHIEWVKFLDQPQFMEKVNSATAIVGHAGTGSILNALELGKPILVMPRRAELMETRNDHQVATAERFSVFKQVLVASGPEELMEKLDLLEGLQVQERITPWASAPLLNAIQAFMRGEDVVSQIRQRGSAHGVMQASGLLDPPGA